MANGVHNVHTPPLQGVDPRLLRLAAGGKTAQANLGSLTSGPALAAALRQQETPYPEMRGRGLAATAPSIAEVLGGIALRRQGASRVNAMQQQADALRGDVAQGAQAQMIADLQAKDFADQQARDAAAAKVQAAQQAANLKYERDVAMEEERAENRAAQEAIESGRLKSGFTTYIDPKTNETINVARTGQGFVDSAMQPVTLDDRYVPYTTYVSELGLDASALEGVSNTHKTDLAGYYSGIRQLGEIQDLAQNFTEQDKAVLNRPGLNAVINAATPAAFETYVKNNLRGITPRAKDYLTRVNEFSAGLRNQLFGSALTVNETQLSEAFLPSPETIGLDSQLARMDVIYDMMSNRIRGIDDVYNTNFVERRPDYTRASAAPVAETAPAATGQVNLDDMTNDELKAYLASGGTEIPERLRNE